MKMVCLNVHFLMAVMFTVILATLNNMVLGENISIDPNDIHGGVTMGVSNAVCDNGKANIQIDWDPNSSDEYTCYEGSSENYKVRLHSSHCDKTAQQPLHICYPRAINYTEDLPTSGSHRPLWPKYGEYLYLPPQRWIHSLEHGAVVFLYHPCAEPSEIEKFKAVARDCLHRYILSPYKKLPPDMNFALLVWQCRLVMSNVDLPLMVNFIKTRALNGPERVSRDGQYDVGLLRHAGIVSDVEDSELCPRMRIMAATAEVFKNRSAARRSKYQQSDQMWQRYRQQYRQQMPDVEI
ncbi:unnamed protein product [Candidula unifasciata]|uniref:DUF3105 domain-containing protein n=1 Tax=Candidula unifasciata TaxID=100452 RepID=A0A8S3YKD6_9EUPU|nr:unnamed protein product [Candidula unifasciata]